VNRFEGCEILWKEGNASEWENVVTAVIRTKDGKLFYVVNSVSFDCIDGLSEDLSVYEVKKFDEKTGEVELGSEVDLKKKEWKYLSKKIVV
jgi:hypothetical protein